MPRISKEEAELAIFSKFVSAYERAYGIRLEKFRHTDKPDFQGIHPITNEYLGIEITGFYQDDNEAKIQYWGVEQWEAIECNQEQLLKMLNIVLKKNAKEAYSYLYSGILSLAIYNGSFIFNTRLDMDFIKKDIQIPNNIFNNFWIILHAEGKESVELYEIQ